MQASPQSEQSEDVPIWVSQPSLSDKLQSAQPESQGPIWHVPVGTPLQLPDAFV
ncbi:unnamed protein product [marine sediment metagenome]|uniref:Uncharacterized protein n=1 Tax=marine sediment metagenome TaxID=412755 RepID=X0VBG2_9ZZZZ